MIPSRPAAPANSFSSSRDVRVSIFLNSSFNSLTTSMVRPVYLRVSAIASSMSAKLCTHLRTVMVSPVSAANPCVSTPQFLLKKLTVRIHLLCVSFDSSLMAARRVFSSLSCEFIRLNSSVPCSVPFRFSLRILMEYSMSRTVDLSRFLSVSPTSFVSLLTVAISLCAFLISSSYLSMVRTISFCSALTSLIRDCTCFRLSDAFV